jgi:hypothetical protein
VGNNDTGHEQLSAPDAPGLTPLQRTSQARLSDRTIQAQRLGQLYISGRLSEEQIRVH